MPVSPMKKPSAYSTLLNPPRTFAILQNFCSIKSLRFTGLTLILPKRWVQLEFAEPAPVLMCLL